jgi:hypothetical protein
MQTWLRVIAAWGPLREGVSGVGSELESVRYLVILAIFSHAQACALNNLVPILTPGACAATVDAAHQSDRTEVQRHVQHEDVPVDFNRIELFPKTMVKWRSPNDRSHSTMPFER